MWLSGFCVEVPPATPRTDPSQRGRTFLMGWNLIQLHKLKKSLPLILAAGMLALGAGGALAQGGIRITPPLIWPRNNPPTIDDAYNSVSNAYLILGIGVNKN